MIFKRLGIANAVSFLFTEVYMTRREVLGFIDAWRSREIKKTPYFFREQFRQASHSAWTCDRLEYAIRTSDSHPIDIIEAFHYDMEFYSAAYDSDNNHNMFRDAAETSFYILMELKRLYERKESEQ